MLPLLIYAKARESYMHAPRSPAAILDYKTQMQDDMSGIYDIFSPKK